MHVYSEVSGGGGTEAEVASGSTNREKFLTVTWRVSVTLSLGRSFKCDMDGFNCTKFRENI